MFQILSDKSQQNFQIHLSNNNLLKLSQNSSSNTVWSRSREDLIFTDVNFQGAKYQLETRF